MVLDIPWTFDVLLGSEGLERSSNQQYNAEYVNSFTPKTLTMEIKACF